MPQFGYIKRQYPHVRVLRGYNPNEPHTRTAAYPVAAGVTLLSGQVTSLTWNGTTSQYEWHLGVDDAAKTPYIVLDDSLNFDIQEAGTCPALSSKGQFEIATAFYNTADQYNLDTPLTYDGTTGNVKPTTIKSGEPILGFVSKGGGNGNGPYSLVGVDSSCVNTNVIAFETNYDANHS